MSAYILIFKGTKGLKMVYKYIKAIHVRASSFNSRRMRRNLAVTCEVWQDVIISVVSSMRTRDLYESFRHKKL